MRRSWAAALLFAGLAGPLLAQPPADTLEAARARQKIADGKAEAVVREAVRDAERLARTNPAKAAQLLRAAQSDLDLSAAIGGETRKTLTTLLQARLARLDGKPLPKDAPATPADDPAPTAKPNKETVLAAARAEVKEVREAVDQVQKLRDLGQTADADKAVAALAAKYPNNPSVIFLGRRDDLGRAAADARELAKLQSDAWVKNAQSLARSGIAAGNDIEFPADWKEKTRRRAKQVELTPR